MRARKRIWVNAEIQWAFVQRVALYWLECLLTVFFMTVCWTALTQPVSTSGQLFGTVAANSLPVLGASLLLLPLVMLDTIRTSHRFVGPLVRVRQTLRALSSGQPVSPISYRNDDYWKEFADDVNQLIHEVERLRKSASTKGQQPSVALTSVGHNDE